MTKLMKVRASFSSSSRPCRTRTLLRLRFGFAAVFVFARAAAGFERGGGFDLPAVGAGPFAEADERAGFLHVTP